MIFTFSSGTIKNNGITNVMNGSPFKPNTMTQGSELSNALKCYTNNSGDVLGANGKKTWGCGSGQYISYKKIQAVGKTANKIGLFDDSLLGYKSGNDLTSRNIALNRVRAQGSVAPKKKGAFRG